MKYYDKKGEGHKFMIGAVGTNVMDMIDREQKKSLQRKVDKVMEECQDELDLIRSGDYPLLYSPKSRHAMASIIDRVSQTFKNDEKSIRLRVYDLVVSTIFGEGVTTPQQEPEVEIFRGDESTEGVIVEVTPEDGGEMNG